jgi:hypothetical protein
MKTKNSIKASIFLFAILFSFSINAYNSLKAGSEHFYSRVKSHVDPTSNGIEADNLLFEELENENDNDSFESEIILILPFSGFTFNSILSQGRIFPTSLSPEAVEPLYLSIRVLRI